MASEGMQQLVLRDFSGGWNVRDAPSEVADNESPDCLNVTFDERGGIVKRLGRTKYNSSQLNASAFLLAFYWQKGQLLIVQQGASLYTSSGAGTFSAAVKTFTTTARCALVDFAGYLVAVHPVDGVFVSTTAAAASFTQTAGGTANMEAVRGDVAAVWQNKIWVGGDLNNPPRLWRCNPGDPQKWTIATDWVDVRDKDSAIITALGVGQGEDTVGRAGLIAFKSESTYRVNDSATGSYDTLDSAYGAGGPMAVTSNLGVLAAISNKGVIVLHPNAYGTQANPFVVSRKIEPLFRENQLNFAQERSMVAGVYRDRIVFSVSRIVNGASVAYNNFTLEFHTQVGWFVPHDFGTPVFATWGKNSQKLYSSSNTNGYLYETFKGGSDDGAAIECRYQTRWFEPARGGLCRYRRMLVSGRGSFSLYDKFDYDLGPGSLNTVAITGTGMLWGTGLWGLGLWGAQTYESYQPFFSIGLGRSVSFKITESSSSSALGPKLLDDGTAPEVGSFACYGIEVELVTLGNA